MRRRARLYSRRVQPAAVTVPRRASRWDRFVAFRQRYAKREIALVLTGGFLFDVLTLGRIDDWRTLVQQAAYLLVLGLLLAADELWRERAKTWGKWRQRAWTFNEDAIHFLFGSLLSAYAIFYFKSASGIPAFLFLGALFALLIANELPSVRHLGDMIRMALYSFCLTSFFAYLFPVLTGRINKWQFFIAAALSSAISWQFVRLARNVAGGWKAPIKEVLLPAFGVQALLVGLYALGAIPPVPLSLKAIGIYHRVDAKGETWHLAYRPQGIWGWWQRGERVFKARPGDQLYCFTRIFAPHRFKDQVKLRFWRREGDHGWVVVDSIPLRISGGREQGFRGYGVKKHYTPGEWRVAVVTADDRIVGGTKFWIETDDDPEDPLYEVEDAGPTGRRAIPVFDHLQEQLPEIVPDFVPDILTGEDAGETPEPTEEETPEDTEAAPERTEAGVESTPVVPEARDSEIIPPEEDEEPEPSPPSEDAAP